MSNGNRIDPLPPRACPKKTAKVFKSYAEEPLILQKGKGIKNCRRVSWKTAEVLKRKQGCQVKLGQEQFSHMCIPNLEWGIWGLLIPDLGL